MPETAITCMKAAQRTLQQFTSAASPHTARILAWDDRILALYQGMAEVHDQMGDSVHSLACLDARAKLEAEQCGEFDEMTAAVAAAARSGMW
jgi:hypothetical protein